MKYYFIVNPHSKTSKGRFIWQKQLKPCLLAAREHWKVFYTRYSGHCTQIVSQLTKQPKEPITIVVLGGDGTLNEALNGIESFDKVTLSYIPTGSSNDFARGMKLKGTPAKQLRNILQKRHECWLDFGVVKAPGKKQQRFIVSSGIGFDAYVTDEALHSPIKNVLNAIHLGKLTYALIAIGQLIKLPLQTATLTLDGSKTLRFKRFYFAASHNLPYEGGGFKFAPDARPDDGILHICAVHGLSKLIVPALLPTAFWGGHLKFSGVESFSCQKMHITLDNPYPVHTDGETYHPRRELDVWCEAGKLHFVC